MFLNEMEQVVPGETLCELVKPYHPVAGNGRPPRPLEHMMPVYLLLTISSWPPLASAPRVPSTNFSNH